jgi:hypothetical protein
MKNYFFAQRSAKCGFPHEIIKWTIREETRSNYKQHSTQEASYETDNTQERK